MIVNDEDLYNFASMADPDTFAKKLECNDHPYACVFPNIGKSSMLVSPKQVDTDPNHYGHLAAFVRNAPLAQVQSVWKLVASTFLEQLELRRTETIFFSTAGNGVAWLHFRFDNRPKYYRYGPYRNQAAAETERVYTVH